MTAPAPLDPEVAAALRPPLFGYAKPLKVAWNWNRSGTPGDLARAAQLLAALADKYDEQPVRFEQAFNFVRQKRPADAVAVLEQAEATFQRTLGEDALALWGRIHKDEGDAALARGDLAAAEAAFRKAQALYDRAHATNRDRFPGINVATLAFLRGGLVKAMSDGLLAAAPDDGQAARAMIGTDDGQAARAMIGTADDLRRVARQRATELLATQSTWKPRLPDDQIWMDATAAEAAVLCGDWASAARDYAAALHPDHQPKPFHFDSVYAQVRRLKAGYDRLGEKVSSPLADPAAFFSDLAAKAGVAWTAPAI